MDGWWLRRLILMTWRDIISNVLWVLLFGGLDEAVLRRVGANEDESSPILLRLMANGKGNKIGKVEDMPVHHAPQEIGVVSVEDAGALSQSCQSVGQDGVYAQLVNQNTKVELDRSWIIKICHNGLEVKGRIEFQEPKDDAAPFLFFKVGTTVFLPCGFDMVVDDGVVVGARAWQEGVGKSCATRVRDFGEGGDE
ncbi:hypothetical protein GOBAR_AA03304 [Gossypium barbadense]|uniref:Uncharacterized protein n=1 Tax=Gossypium barbadense TaxID=3634 RepID=A0A2P5YNU9_GOSBA|nr:hypothetical protein GOBAR_AA03304 [Gossypium barbadense]